MLTVYFIIFKYGSQCTYSATWLHLARPRTGLTQHAAETERTNYPALSLSSYLHTTTQVRYFVQHNVDCREDKTELYLFCNIAQIYI